MASNNEPRSIKALLSLKIVQSAECPSIPEEDNNVVRLEAHKVMPGLVGTILLSPAPIRNGSK